jgi:pSer/pThr/pTyr-binding forkhead associated (FHA) protein
MFEVTVRLGDRLVTKFRGQGETTIGRDPGCELMLDNLGVSRRHAQLREVAGRFVVEDLNSTNGVFVNGHQITAAAQVNSGDEIKIGKFSLIFQQAHEEQAMAPAFDINQTIAMDGMALEGAQRREPRFVASVTRDVFHKVECNWIKATPSTHRVYYATEDEARDDGRRPCRTCFSAPSRPR